MRLVAAFLAILGASAFEPHNHSDHDHEHEHDERCGTHTDVAEYLESGRIAEALATKVCSHPDLQNIRICWSPEERAKRPVIIPVWYHVVHNGNTGRLTAAQVQAQFAQTNKDFAGLEDRSIPGWVAMDITFRLAGTTYTDNPTWFADLSQYEQQIKQLVHRDNRYNFNQYFGGLRGGLLGFCNYPNSFPETSFRHGCVNLWTSIPGGSSNNYNQGKTTTHETGHGIGLMHTFQGGCNGGDQVEDTCNQASATSGCPAFRDSCGRGCPDPINNYMDYSFDRCMTQFTPGQNRRANTQLFTFRPSLYLTAEEKQAVEAAIPGAWNEAEAFAQESEARYVARRLAQGYDS
jgi:hypothetical protein